MAKVDQKLADRAADRIRHMPLSAKRWFWSDFDANTDLHESDVADLLWTAPDWVCGDKDLTDLGQEVRRQLASQVPA